MNLSDHLFDTEALKVSPYNRPFFYTSGKLGPFYINTHFLYGSEKDAAALLGIIDGQLEKDKKDIPSVLFGHVTEQYKNNNIFRDTADALIRKITDTMSGSDYIYISGGERRDWFFSVIAAYLLDKKHITIFKDGSIIVSYNGKNLADDIIPKNAGIIHAVDLVTEASSFKNYWIPALHSSGNRIRAVYSIVDRKQGGREYFRSEDIIFHSLIEIDRNFFSQAVTGGYIDPRQNEMIQSYFLDPDGSMRNFLINDPDFLNNIPDYDSKSISKLKSMTENNIYDLPDEYIKNIKKRYHE
jgi:hypothetical protein